MFYGYKPNYWCNISKMFASLWVSLKKYMIYMITRAGLNKKMQPVPQTLCQGLGAGVYIMYYGASI